MSSTTSRLPVWNPLVEKAVLGSMLLAGDGEVILQIAKTLQPENFFDPACQLTCRAMLAAFDKNKRIDTVLVGEALREMGKFEDVGGVTFLGECVEACATKWEGPTYASIVRRASRDRMFIYALQRLAAEGELPHAADDDYIARCISEIATHGADDQQKGPTPFMDGFEDTFSSLESGKMPPGLVPTGYAKLDRNIVGLWPGMVTVLAARPSMGKTAFAMNIAQNAALNGKKVLIFSFEQSRNSLHLRFLARFAGIDFQNLRHRRIAGNEWPRIVTAATEKINKMPIWLETPPSCSAERLQRVCAAHKGQHGLDLVIIDHLGYLKDRGELTEERTRAMRGVASLAKELDVSVLLLSQLNRAVEARPDKHPVLSDLRQSGTIEEDARTVLMLYRPYYYDKTADEHILETMIAKDADGQPNMAVNLWCDLAHMEILDDPPAAKVDGKHYGREY